MGTKNMVKITAYFIPTCYSIIILKTPPGYLYVYNMNFILVAKLPTYYYINPNTSCILIYENKTIGTLIDQILWQFNTFLTTLIKFKGKAFKLTKYKTYLDMLFNYAHLSFIIFQKIYIKKIYKTKLILLYPSLIYLQYISAKFINLRKISFYTKNGLRLQRQYIKKRKGKTSLK